MEMIKTKEFLYEINKKLKNKIYLYPVYILDENVDFVYWEDLGLNTYNSIVKKAKENFSTIKFIDKTNIFDVLLGVLS